MRRVRILAVLCLAVPLLPLAARADEAPLGPEAFDAFTRGKTFFYAIAGQAYGAEQYLPGHRVIWAFAGQDCRFGRWYPGPAGQICFDYEAPSPGPQCWVFTAEGQGLRARFVPGAGKGDTENGAPAAEVVSVRESTTPLVCPGPKVGS